MTPRSRAGLSEVWGDVRDTPEAKRQLIATYKAELTATQLAIASPSQGRAVFAATCGACHVLFGEGGKVGPDLTGGERRKNLDTLLTKIVDPNSELPIASRFTNVTLRDGRTVSGIIDNQTATTLTLRSMADPTTIRVADMASAELLSMSAGAGGPLRRPQRRGAPRPLSRI